MFRRLLYKAKLKKHKRVLVERKRTKQFILPSHAKRALLFRSTRWDRDEYAEALKNAFPNVEFVELWHVSTGTFAPSDTNAAMIMKSNLRKSGYRGADRAVELLDTPFDWLIDLSNDNSELAELLLLESRAKCKISWRSLGSFSADITVKDVEDRCEFVNSIKVLFENLSTKRDG